jgi:hypothetical protein
MRYRSPVNEELRGFRVSSAQRGKRGPSTVVVATAAVVLIAIILVLISQEDEAPVVTPPPTPLPTDTPIVAPSPTANAVVERASEWVAVSIPESTPTPWPAQWPTSPPPPTRRPPSPTPRVSECVTYRWTSVQVFRPSAHVLVEINAANRCNRDLGPLDLWFQITGWRDGDLVQTVRGHPFDSIRRRQSGDIAIGLPGSLDWYDEISVEIVD